MGRVNALLFYLLNLQRLILFQLFNVLRQISGLHCACRILIIQYKCPALRAGMKQVTQGTVNKE